MSTRTTILWGALMALGLFAQREAQAADPFAQAPHKKWYVATADGQRFGPFHSHVLLGHIAAGEIHSGHYLGREDWRQWETFAAVKRTLPVHDSAGMKQYAEHVRQWVIADLDRQIAAVQSKLRANQALIDYYQGRPTARYSSVPRANRPGYIEQQQRYFRDATQRSIDSMTQGY